MSLNSKKLIFKRTISVIVLLILTLFGSFSKTSAAKPSDFNLHDGDLISAIFSKDPDVYIINDSGYKRIFLNPEIFKFYKHLGGFANVKLVTPEIRDAFPTVGLFRNCEKNDPKVYGLEAKGEDKGQLRWIDTPGDQAVKDDPDFFKKVFCINDKEFKWYPKGEELKSVKEVPEYHRATSAIPAIPATPASPSHPFSPIASGSHPLTSPTITPRPASGSFSPTPMPTTATGTINLSFFKELDQKRIRVLYDTNKEATVVLEYGATTGYGQTSALLSYTSRDGIYYIGTIYLNLDLNASYHVRAKATTKSGEVFYSGDHSFIFGATSYPLAPPVSVTASLGTGKILISWPAGTNPRFEVSRNILGSTSWQAIRNLNGSYFEDSNVIEGTSYKYKVYGCDVSSGVCSFTSTESNIVTYTSTSVSTPAFVPQSATPTQPASSSSTPTPTPTLTASPTPSVMASPSASATPTPAPTVSVGSVSVTSVSPTSGSYGTVITVTGKGFYNASYPYYPNSLNFLPSNTGAGGNMVSDTQINFTVPPASSNLPAGTYNLRLSVHDASLDLIQTFTVTTPTCTSVGLALNNIPANGVYTVGMDTSVNYTWNCLSGGSASKVEMWLDKPDNSSLLLNSGSGSTQTLSLAIGNLTTGTYILKACLGGGNCTANLASQFRRVFNVASPTPTPTPSPTPTPIPPPPLTVTIASITPYSPIGPSSNLISSITIQWDTTASNTNYKEIWRKFGTGNWMLIGIGQPNNFSDLNVGAGMYSYKVNACSSGSYLAPSDCGPDSNIMTTTLAMGSGSDTTPPSKPTNLSVWLQDNRNFLSWTASTDNTGVVGYNIYRNGAYLKSACCIPSEDDFLFGSSAPFSYTVAAYDAAGNVSEQSSPVTFVHTFSRTNGSNSFATISRNLTIGSTGDDVKQLQALLVNEVHYQAGLITGYFGRLTREAVKSLQEKYGITPASGYFGELTRRVLRAIIFN